MAQKTEYVKKYKVQKKCGICKTTFNPSYLGTFYCDSCRTKMGKY